MRSKEGGRMPPCPRPIPRAQTSERRTAFCAAAVPLGTAPPRLPWHKGETTTEITMPRPGFARALALLTLIAAPVAQAQDRLTPGFWIFPHEPALAAETLAQLCQHGMSLVQADGTSVSFLADIEGGRNRMVIDSEQVCHVEDGFADCMTRHYTDTGIEDFRSATEFLRDDNGHLRAFSTNIATGAHTQSYPQICPPTAVRDFMVGWLALGAEG